MKLLISNQHGAIVMALLPFIYGMLLGGVVWAHLFLLLAWCALYLMTYPFLNLFKGKNLPLNQQWTLIYFVASLIFALPALYYQWHVIYFIFAMLPFVAANIYFTLHKDERNIWNDIAAIAIFALAGMASYYFSSGRFDLKMFYVACYPALFFIGTTLYVKSMMRERKNPRYLRASILFHALCVLVFVLTQTWLTALAFAPGLLRAIYLPRRKLSVKQVGLTEFVISALFFCLLLIATYQ